MSSCLKYVLWWSHSRSADFAGEKNAKCSCATAVGLCTSSEPASHLICIPARLNFNDFCHAFIFVRLNKSSAVTEMGDHFTTIDRHMSRGLRKQAALPASVNPEPYLWAAVPLSWGARSPFNTKWSGSRPGLSPYQVTS